VPDGGDLRRSREVADALIRDHTSADARVGRLCPRCGSSEHGRPVVKGGDGPPAHASVAYAAGLVAVAVTRLGPVGVDLEAVTEFAGLAGRRTAEAMGLSAHVPDRDLALAWTRVEAILKATGEGLTADPREIVDGQPDGIRVLVPDLGDDLVGCVAVRTGAGDVRCRAAFVSR
jgi:4'-phosphopantetheinyl transferase